jgi:hypothetical protein
VIKEFIKHNKLQDSVTVLDKLPEDIGETDIPEKVNDRRERFLFYIFKMALCPSKIK